MTLGAWSRHSSEFKKNTILVERIEELCVMRVSFGRVVTLLDAWENLVKGPKHSKLNCAV
jgi:hypothetical protein